MIWTDKCLMELTHHNVFDSSQHRLRFRDLVFCYYDAPFFNKALCKCMYLASWDDSYFADMLVLLNDMTIEDQKDLTIMIDQYQIEALQEKGTAAQVYQLYYCFITETEYQHPDYTLIDAEEAHMIRQALITAQFIDDLPEPHEEDTGY